MSKNCENKYYLGLDIGTSSVGWAVTDENYNVVKKHGKALWGVRLFDEANTAQERRTHRIARRMTQRRSERIDLLQELFAQAICEKDPGFFLRLNESAYYAEDKTTAMPYSLFSDKNYTDKDYHKEYPTIYHLRQALMKGGKEFDVRLVYLAIHHILKHRGHFLFENFEIKEDGVSGLDEAYTALSATVESFIEFPLPMDKKEEVGKILTNKKYGVSAKTKELANTLGFAKEKNLTALVKLISGGTANLGDLFGDEALKEFEKNKVCFEKAAYEEDESAIQAELGERFDLIAACKAIYDWSLLADLMGNHTSISDAKIAAFGKHAKDLKILKKLLRQDKKAYNSVFNSTAKDSYSAYVGICMKNGKKLAVEKKCSTEDFFKNLDKITDKLPECNEKAYIKGEIETGSLLPKAVTKINGVIPYQLHLYELRQILRNAEKYLPFLNIKDQYGTVAEKIEKLFTFRIPYYVGPLNPHSENAWIVKKDAEGRILPWNFDEKVDTEASGEQFIRRMTNKCTYLLAEDVLPKYSLLYSEYTVLNELNNLRVGRANEKISVERKQKIFSELFLKTKKVTAKKLTEFLVKEGISKEDAVQIAGIDGDFKSSMASRIDLVNILGSQFNTELAENIILDITIFGSDRGELKKRLAKKYSILTADQIKQLSKLPYNGWGRLSETLLTDVLPKQCENTKTLIDRETGEPMNLITALRKTNYNLMQLLSGEFGYFAAISERNNAENKPEKLNYDAVAEMYLSPSVKRPLWQTLKIVRELRKITGCNPERIFIEMARGGETEKKRTKTRKQRLLDLYKACKDDQRDWSKEIEELTDEQLRSDKLYLYYTQMGKSMYTGDHISIEQLWNNNVYDIDHIYPRSATGDDSLDNRVLVERHVNAYKSDEYPLTEECRKKMHTFWSKLLENELISKEKYRRLTRNSRLTEEEKADFVGRQLVETRQSTKAAAEVLQDFMPETKIIYSKAGNVSKFRQHFDFIKVRELNDYHHTKDAYLNIVVGNAFYTKFTADPRNFFKQNNAEYSLNEDAFYGREIKRGNYVAWTPGKDGTIATVSKWMNKNNILFTRMPHEVAGKNAELFKQQPIKKGEAVVPLKGKLPYTNLNNYGGYYEPKTAYFVCWEESKKGKKQRIIETMPLYLAINDSLDEAKIEELIKIKRREQREVSKVLIQKLLVHSLIEIDGVRFYISGTKGNGRHLLLNATQLCIDNNDARDLKRVLKFVERRKNNKNATIDDKHDSITDDNTMHLYKLFVSKLQEKVYNIKLSAQVKTLQEHEKDFISLSMEDRCSVLTQILHYFQCSNSAKSDLSLIGGTKATGEICLSSIIANKTPLFVIYQSVTGFFEKKIQLAPYEQ